MRILITNDDGIHSPGLDSLVDIARQLSDDVWVVAPEYDQSGVAHSLSLNDPLRLRRVGEQRFAVKGTPTDCVILGVRHVLDGNPPDLLLSGINRGHNLGEDVTYSGTVAGAIEGALLGVPAIALSQAYPPGYRDRVSYATAEAHGARVIADILEAGLPRGGLVNINFPNCGPDEVEGVRATRQGQRPQWQAQVEGRLDGRHNPYFWIVYGHEIGDPGPDTDLRAIADRCISVTPLKIDMTDHSMLDRLAGRWE
ncbi:5'/3'-nucleotidase SurE [Terrihabitans sp. B22-R8]|uniref:5'/3'-nucleotidase SurE n=1 Tax=Terrihabitans sp. B22-R8 TaxID=3425128 RepID=UPI00403C29B5